MKDRKLTLVRNLIIVAQKDVEFEEQTSVETNITTSRIPSQVIVGENFHWAPQRNLNEKSNLTPEKKIEYKINDL